MKKTLLLMGILVSFLSCQKDSDKCPYLNTAEKHVNDLGVPIQTCGNEKVVKLGLEKVWFWAPSSIEFDPVTKYGEVSIFHDSNYLYIKSADTSGVDNYKLYVGPENLLNDPNASITPYLHADDVSVYKIPISAFSPNETVAIMFYKEYGGSMEAPDGYSYPTENLIRFYGNLPDVKFARNSGVRSVWNDAYYVLYKITPCCNPNE